MVRWNQQCLLPASLYQQGALGGFLMDGRQRLVWQIVAMAIVTVPAMVRAAQPFEGKTWQLSDWTTEGDPQVLVVGTDLTVRFNQGQVNGSAGCNNFVGRYTVGSDQISMGGPVATTRKACSPEVQTQEDQFIAALQGASGVDLTAQGQLRIAYTNAQGRGVLIFQPPRPAVQSATPASVPVTSPGTSAPASGPIPALW